jgi:hypothetical protein
MRQTTYCEDRILGLHTNVLEIDRLYLRPKHPYGPSVRAIREPIWRSLAGADHLIARVNPALTLNSGVVSGNGASP